MTWICETCREPNAAITVARLERERDEARAEIARLRACVEAADRLVAVLPDPSPEYQEARAALDAKEV